MTVRDIPDPWEGRFWLTDAMARTAGVSIADAVARGELSLDATQRLGRTCANCTKTDNCLLYLAEREGDPPGDIPGYCLNRELLQALAAAR